MPVFSANCLSRIAAFAFDAASYSRRRGAGGTKSWREEKNKSRLHDRGLQIPGVEESPVTNWTYSHRRPVLGNVPSVNVWRHPDVVSVVQPRRFFSPSIVLFVFLLFMNVFTIGYQGLSIDEYVQALSSHGIGIVLDVRETAWSYKVGFSKKPLTEALTEVGIAYSHIKAAGNPSTNRKTARSTRECLQRYRVYLAANPACLRELSGAILAAHKNGQPACLTCYERFPEECHRSVLLDTIKLENPGLRVTHIWEGQDAVVDLFAKQPIFI